MSFVKDNKIQLSHHFRSGHIGDSDVPLSALEMATKGRTLVNGFR